MVNNFSIFFRFFFTLSQKKFKNVGYGFRIPSIQSSMRSDWLQPEADRLALLVSLGGSSIGVVGVSFWHGVFPFFVLLLLLLLFDDANI